MSHLFISYSRKDDRFRARLTTFLLAAGLDVWSDEHLTPGDPDWRDAIQEAIEQSYAIIVALSPPAKQSRWVGMELQYAETFNIPIIPVLARGSTRSAIPIELIGRQFTDARRDLTAAMPDLLDALFPHLPDDDYLRLSQHDTQLSPVTRSRRRRSIGGFGAIAVALAAVLVAFFWPRLQPPREGVSLPTLATHTPEPDTRELETPQTPDPSATPEPEIATLPPTGTPSPSPSPTPGETGTPLPVVEVTTSFANIRTGPGLNYDVVVTVEEGNRVEVITVDPNTRWLNVRIGAFLGWISRVVVGDTPDPIPTAATIPPSPTTELIAATP